MNQDALKQRFKQIIEAILFAANEPLSAARLNELIYAQDINVRWSVTDLIKELQLEYKESGRAIEIHQLPEGFILKTRPEFAEYIQRLRSPQKQHQEKLSQAALEVLSIISYRQPITRAEIDAIRGVDSSGSLYVLMDRQLVECIGKRESIGRPSLYSVTPLFFQFFNLSSIQELPFYSELNESKKEISKT